MTDYESVANNLNSGIDNVIDGCLASAFRNEEASMEIVSVINQVRSSEVKNDILSSFTLESQAIIVGLITTETAELQELQGAITSEGKRKNEQQAQANDESEES